MLDACPEETLSIWPRLGLPLGIYRRIPLCDWAFHMTPYYSDIFYFLHSKPDEVIHLVDAISELW